MYEMHADIRLSWFKI